MKIGQYVRQNLIQTIKGLDEKDFQELLNSVEDGSAKTTFGLHNVDVKLLVKNGEIPKDLENRYYKEPFKGADGREYRLTSQWYDNQYYKVTEWIKKHTNGNEKSIEDADCVENVSDYLKSIRGLKKEKIDLEAFKGDLFEKLGLDRDGKYPGINMPESIQQMNEDSYKPMFFYRGHADTSYQLCSGVRRLAECPEDTLFKFFESNVPESTGEMSNLGKLVYMQHHKYYTRLLDITESPLVALYFACQKPKYNDDDKHEENSDGEVLVFSPELSTVLYERDEASAFLAALPLLNSKQKERLLDVIKDGVQKTGTTCLKNFPCDCRIEIGKILKKGGAVISDDFNVMEVLFPRIIRPNAMFERIRRQSSLFIIDPLASDEEMGSQWICKHIKIPRGKKKDILEELDYLGINEFVLFLEADNIKNCVKHRCCGV